MTVRNVAGTCLLFARALGGQVQTPEKSPTSCVNGGWSTPRELHTGEGYSAYVKQPSIMPMRGAAFIAGFPALSFDSAGKRVWPLASDPAAGPRHPGEVAIGVLARPDGESVLVPPPHDLAVVPILMVGALDDRGIAHFVWGSNDSTPLKDLTAARSIWYARFDGEHWTTPVRILTSPGTLAFNAVNSSQLFIRERTMHFVVGVQREGLDYLRADDGVWSVRHVHMAADRMAYPHVVELRNGRVVLIAQGASESPRTHMNSGLYVTWSANRGVTWTPSVKVSRPDGEPAYDARLLVDENDVLYAFWYQQTDVEGRPSLTPAVESPGRIHVAQSTDGGATWRRFPPSTQLS